MISLQVSSPVPGVYVPQSTDPGLSIHIQPSPEYYMHANKNVIGAELFWNVALKGQD